MNPESELPANKVELQRAIRAYDESKAGANTRQVGGDHYLTQPIQPWDYIHRNGIGFLAGSAIKYLSRYKTKDGVQDLEKAKHFLEKLIEEERSHTPLNPKLFSGLVCGYTLAAGEVRCTLPAGHGGRHTS